MTISDIRCVLLRPGFIDAGEWHRPKWHIAFKRGSNTCYAPVTMSTDGNRPLGQDVIDAMRKYIKRKETTEHDVLNCRIVE